jgi:hypothetical protein
MTWLFDDGRTCACESKKPTSCYRQVLFTSEMFVQMLAHARKPVKLQCGVPVPGGAQYTFTTTPGHPETVAVPARHGGYA